MSKQTTLVCNWCGTSENDVDQIVHEDEERKLAVCDQCVEKLLESFSEDCTFTQEEGNQINKIAQEEGVEFSEVIRYAVMSYVQAQPDKGEGAALPKENWWKTESDKLRCSWCGKPQDKALKLVSNMSDTSLCTCEDCMEFLRDQLGDPVYSHNDLTRIRKVAAQRNITVGSLEKEAVQKYLKTRVASV